MMTDEEIANAVNYANAIDPRIQSNIPTYELWARVLRQYSFAQVQLAVQIFYEHYSDPAKQPTITAPEIRKIINLQTDRNEARGRAIEATKPVRTPDSYRQRNPEEWDRLFEQGRADRQADLRARGLIT